MDRIRAFYDADRAKNFSAPTKHRTDKTNNELLCSICAARLFVDDFVFKSVSKAIEESSENPFLCEECLNEYEEAAHQR